MPIKLISKLADGKRVCVKEVLTSEDIAELEAQAVVAEWCLIYPNGNAINNVDCAFAMDEDNNDFSIGKEVIKGKIKNQLWQLCRQYTL